MTARLSRAVVPAFLTIVTLGVAGTPPARAGPPPATLTAVASVDFAHPEKVHSLVGFLHGLDDTQPPDRVVVPLHPTLWRGSLASASYDRATALGARYMFVLSDLWGYPGAGWYGRQAPWVDCLREGKKKPALTVRNVIVDQSLKARIVAKRVPHRVKFQHRHCGSIRGLE